MTKYFLMHCLKFVAEFSAFQVLVNEKWQSSLIHPRIELEIPCYQPLDMYSTCSMLTLLDSPKTSILGG